MYTHAYGAFYGGGGGVCGDGGEDATFAFFFDGVSLSQKTHGLLQGSVIDPRPPNSFIKHGNDQAQRFSLEEAERPAHDPIMDVEKEFVQPLILKFVSNLI